MKLYVVLYVFFLAVHYEYFILVLILISQIPPGMRRYQTGLTVAAGEIHTLENRGVVQKKKKKGGGSQVELIIGFGER